MQDAAASTSNLTFGDKDLDKFQAQNFVGKKTIREIFVDGKKKQAFFPENQWGHGFFCMGFS